MKELLEDSAFYFYTNIFALASALQASLFGFFFRKRHKGLQFMFIYPMASFLQMAIYYLLTYLLFIKTSAFISISTIIFLIIELSCIIFFYLSIINNTLLKKIITSIGLIYLLFFLLYIIDRGILIDLPIQFYFLQSFIILFFAVFHLIDLFSDKPRLNLLNEPSFWITIGVLLYFICVIPMYVGSKFIFGENGVVYEMGVYSINYICYSIFFLLITRAFLCKAPVKP